MGLVGILFRELGIAWCVHCIALYTCIAIFVDEPVNLDLNTAHISRLVTVLHWNYHSYW